MFGASHETGRTAPKQKEEDLEYKQVVIMTASASHGIAGLAQNPNLIALSRSVVLKPLH